MTAMTTPQDTRYEIRDDDLPSRPPLAAAADYDTAVAAVVRLNEQFRAQLAANGEGGSQLWQRLRVDELRGDGQPVRRYASSASGF